MRFGGIQKTSLIDYPGQVSCVVFTLGCNFHCPYCHNPDLVKEFMAIKDVLKEYAKLAGQDPSEGNGVSVSVNVGGGATRRVIEDPESRHKVLLLVSKMRELGAVDVIDADGVESVEHDGSR